MENEVLNHQLEGRKWLCDDYSIADIANWCWVRVYYWAGVNIDGLENLKNWMNLMEKRPACNPTLTFSLCEIFISSNVAPKPQIDEMVKFL